MPDFLFNVVENEKQQEDSSSTQKPIYDFIGLNSLDFKAPMETVEPVQPSFFIDENAPLFKEDIKKESSSEEHTKQHIRLSLLRASLERIYKDIQKAIEIIDDEIRPSNDISVQDVVKVQELEGKHEFTSITEVLKSATVPRISSTFQESLNGEKIIEGMFDGERMVGPDGEYYTVPPNYASKSKLVEGDSMKLSITPQGSFLYKQIGPIERRRVMAVLQQNPETREYYAHFGEQRWRVLTASVTYYRGASGDEIVLLVPKQKSSTWGAVEHIIKKFI